MNTPAHMALGLAVLGRRATRAEWAVILAGALLPDAFLFAEHFLRGRGAGDLVALDALVDIFNSALVYAAAVAAGLLLRQRWLWLLAAAALLHIAFDLPLHAGDAHAHFWPVSDWRLVSPVSFWDADHHGRLFGVLEGVAFAACLVVIWRRLETRAGQALTALFAVVYLNAFVHFVGHAWAGQHWALW
ncbi:cobalamin biosynthesis protein CobQ [Psychromarinibacter sp. C21-152]|uniref:Cobalamin biosynthesis protein CobQ n=1 Tax=Psychromarinibacter sediminicola TaxID=3033385 RepID=A0AAE3NQK4_9RHOB|nr:cobalamin biosynthesis protein CobQ [Psychromarinibacter sediminicola]MDF0600282.1 cobalamin biosynthesis protein CobQ [Psychromarinibacter sediminicola]